MKRERRALHVPIEIRDENKQVRLSGYAAVFAKRSVGLPGFVEIIKPGAFTRALASPALDVRAFVDHDSRLIIGRTKNGTLKLAEDEQGLRAEIIPPDTQTGRDVITNVRTGNLDGMSFSFSVPLNGDKWEREADGTMLRTLLDVDLYDASIVAFPAYPDTDLAVRSLEAWMARTRTENGPDAVGDLETRRRRLRQAEVEST